MDSDRFIARIELLEAIRWRLRWRSLPRQHWNRLLQLSRTTHEGIALQQTGLVVGLHGVNVEWATMLKKRYPRDRYGVELDVYEQKTAEYADAVVVPSDYMLGYVRSRGWELPSAALAVSNIVKLTSNSAPSPTTSTPIRRTRLFRSFGET
ncbi:hypothetical protein JCM5353_001793 [Sporobolomyces roseus]